MLKYLNKEDLESAMKHISDNVGLSEVCTNYFNNKLSTKLIPVFILKDGLVFVDKNVEEVGGRVFYFFSKIDYSELLDLDFDFDLTCEIIIPSPVPESLKTLLDRLGFNKYSELKRMVITDRVKKNKNYGFNVAVAEVEDVEVLSEIFSSDFDKYSERPPSKRGITKAIESNCIYKKTNEKNELLGFYWSEDKTFSTELKYLYVLKKHRRKGVGGELMNFYIHNTSNIKNRKLWVFDDNIGAINLYSSFGYGFDGLIDHIFIWECS